MKTSFHKRNGRGNASALITTMIFVAVLSVLLASLLQWTGTESVQVTRRYLRIKSFYGAEGVMRRSMAQVQQLIIQNYPLDGYVSVPPAPTQTTLNGLLTANPPSAVSVFTNFTFSSVTIGYVTNAGSTNVYANSQIPPESTDALAGLYSTRATIRCSATGESPGRYSIPKTVQQEFYVDYVPIFQYAVFYNMDSEVFNAEDMTINGKVHVNGTLYFAPLADLAINGNLTCANEMWYGLKFWNSSGSGKWQSYAPGWNSSKGDFDVKNPISGSFVNARSGSGSSSTYYDSKASDWNTGAISRWGGGIKNSDMGIGLITPPIPATVLANSNPNQPYTGFDNPYHVMIEAPAVTSSDKVSWSINTSSDDSDKQKAKMAYSASLVIHRSGTNVYFKVPIRNSSGNVTSFKSINLLNQNQIVPNATATVRDQREYLMDNNKITMTELYLEKLYAAVNSSGQFLTTAGMPVTQDTGGNPITTPTFNGIVYFYDDNYNGTSSSGRRPGLRVDDKPASGTSATKAASQIKSFSLVSENPVYVIGHFNSDGSLNTAPEGTASSGGSAGAPSQELSYDPSSGSNPTGVKPAMIVADAVSFMSASWSRSQDDDNSRISTLFSNRSVSQSTEVNAAVIAGASTTSKTATSSSSNGTTGGINNFPRFMENWGSSSFKISGSMVSLFYSQQAKSYYKQSGTGNYVFDPPVRYYAFNTQYLDPNKLPKGAPLVRRFASGLWTRY
ncbi:MAG: hypothetical protein IT578_01090 [Verrucomicrobiae bacterium]|nr:hypothetical protein [Verrucomicrobiae bacterium]